MSFTLSLQSNNSEPNRLDKDLTLVQEVAGVLKNDTSITTPTFTVEMLTNAVPMFNYVTCEEFGRCYFVRDVRSVGGRLWEVQCEVDVLTSFAAEIRANTAVVKRQEEEWNLYYNDGAFRCYQNPHIITKAFPFGFNPNAANFILAVSGGVSNDAATVSDI